MARELVKDVYLATRSFPLEERFGLSSQMRRAAISIGSNLAEGSSRSSIKEYLRYIEVAAGSAKELQFQILIAKDLGFLPLDHPLSDQCEIMGRTLNALVRGLRKSATG
jgi:four helix bundle protein